MKYFVLLLIAILGAISPSTGLDLNALENELKYSPLREIDVELGKNWLYKYSN